MPESIRDQPVSVRQGGGPVTYRALTDLVPRLNESGTARRLMEVFTRTVQFHLDDPEGPFYLRIVGGQASLARGVAPDAEIEVMGSSGEFARVMTEKVDVTWPIANGHVTVEKGKISELTLLNRILWAAERK